MAVILVQTSCTIGHAPYKADIHIGGFVSGRRGVFKLQNCPLAYWHVLNWSSEIYTALVSLCIMPKYLLFMLYHAEKYL